MHVLHLAHLVRQKVVLLPRHLRLAAVNLLLPHCIHVQLMALSEVHHLGQSECQDTITKKALRKLCHDGPFWKL